MWLYPAMDLYSWIPPSPNQEGSVQVQKSINDHMQGCVSKRTGLLPVTAGNTSTLLQQGSCSGCPSGIYLEELPAQYNVPAACSYSAGLLASERQRTEQGIRVPTESMNLQQT